MRSINLLPSDVPRPPRTSLARIVAATLACVCLFGGSLAYTFEAQEVARLRATLRAREDEYAAYAWLDGDAKRTREATGEMTARLEAARKQVQVGLPVQDILSRLPSVMPAGSWLVQFALADGGRARIDGEARSLETIASFILSLEASGRFKDARVLRVSRSDESGLLAFEAEAQLSPIGGGTP